MCMNQDHDLFITDIQFLESLLGAKDNLNILAELNGKPLDILYYHIQDVWKVWYDNKYIKKDFKTRDEAIKYILGNFS